MDFVHSATHHISKMWLSWQTFSAPSSFLASAAQTSSGKEGPPPEGKVTPVPLPPPAIDDGLAFGTDLSQKKSGLFFVHVDFINGLIVHLDTLSHLFSQVAPVALVLISATACLRR